MQLKEWLQSTCGQKRNFRRMNVRAALCQMDLSKDGYFFFVLLLFMICCLNPLQSCGGLVYSMPWTGCQFVMVPRTSSVTPEIKKPIQLMIIQPYIIGFSFVSRGTYLNQHTKKFQLVEFIKWFSIKKAFVMLTSMFVLANGLYLYFLHYLLTAGYVASPTT